MQRKMYSVGVDVGGSKINAVLFDAEKKKIVRKLKVATPRTSRHAFFAALFDVIERVLENTPRFRVRGIGLALPGQIDFNKNILLNSPNLRILNHTRPARAVAKRFKLKTVMDNDANCFALAEARVGAGTGARFAVGLTLGTGVGGGIMIDGSLYHGAYGSAGEIGWMILDNGKTLEDLASVKFIKRRFKESPRILEEKAKKGNRKAIKLYEAVGANLGVGIANVVNVLDPEIIILGGGLSHAGSLILPQAKKVAREHIISPLSKKSLKVVFGKLGDDAGAQGAALLLV